MLFRTLFPRFLRNGTRRVPYAETSLPHRRVDSQIDRRFIIPLSHRDNTEIINYSLLIIHFGAHRSGSFIIHFSLFILWRLRAVGLRVALPDKSELAHPFSLKRIFGDFVFLKLCSPRKRNILIFRLGYSLARFIKTGYARNRSDTGL